MRRHLLALLLLCVAISSAAVNIMTLTLSNGQVGAAYNQSIAASGGPKPLTWTVISGSLPAGVSLDRATGVLSGTPTTAGTSTFTVRVNDANNGADTQTYTIAIAPPPLVVNASSLPGATLGSPYSAA